MIDKRRTPGDGEEAGPQDDAVIGRALVGSLVVFVILGILAGGGYWLFLRRPPAPPEEKELVIDLPEIPEADGSDAAPAIPFRDVTAEWGIDFVHVNGAYGEKLLPETMGGGCAFLDYDGDQDQDLLLVNSCEWPWRSSPAERPPQMALYRNDGGRFVDVTAEAGLDLTLYGMGAAAGDYDNDGDPDLFLTAVGPNRLLRNDGGRFVDVTADAQVAGAAGEWSTSAAWFDYDNDGLLDLFVCNYILWSAEINRELKFTLVGEGAAYGPPTEFNGTFPYLYHNEGGGKFRDVTQAAGLQVTNPQRPDVAVAKSLGVAPVDLNRDGWLDLVVANDTVENFLFLNQKNGTFQEIGGTAGIAVDRDGLPRGAMGIDVAEVRNDGSLAIAIGNFANEATALYIARDDPLFFLDEAIPTGLAKPSRGDLTFGVFFFDADLDGRLDLLNANGHLEQEINKVFAEQTYAQAPALYWNAGPEYQVSEWVRVPAAKCGADFSRPLVGRGAAYADIDGDGDQDVLITTVGGRPRLLRNDQQLAHHWIRFRLQGTQCNRDAIGARITVQAGEQALTRYVMPTRSYLSQVELPVTFGLGTRTKVDRVTIVWPDGSRQQLGELPAGTTHTVAQPAD